MVKKISYVIITVIFCLIFLAACSTDNFKEKYNTELPSLSEADGWYETLNTDFTNVKSLENTEWISSPHKKRNYEYWCDNMISFSDRGLIIDSYRTENHNCSQCPKSGVFTSGIETRTDSVLGNEGFNQAYGYFEAEVIVPRGQGMWSAFWLQSSNTPKVGNYGYDGTEIDIYESAFLGNPTLTGQAYHYDAYDPPWYRSGGNVTDVKKNLYDGQIHKYALKWTPTEYVMYVDGEAVWAVGGKCISQTPEYLRLTVEIRDDVIGPYGQKLGPFVNHDDDTNKFVIQSVRVFQNKEYEPFIKNIEDFKDKKVEFVTYISVGAVIAAGILATTVILLFIKFKKKKCA